MQENFDDRREQIVSSLVDFGLTRTEAQVYLALVRKGSCTAYRLAKDAGLYRANTYQAIDSLIAKQLVTSSMMNHKQQLTAVSPESLLTVMQLKKEKLESIIPMMDRGFQEEQENVSVFTGVQAFMDLLYLFLSTQESIYVFDIPKYVPEIVKTHITHFHKKRIAQKVRMYHIYDYDAKDRIRYLKSLRYTYAKQSARIRHSVISTIVCGSVTLLVNWQRGVKVVRIEDQDIAKAYLNQFKVLWEEKQENI